MTSPRGNKPSLGDSLSSRVPKDRPVHIFTEGIFDLFHFGHVRMFRQLKEAFPNVKLTAGICSDELVQRFKGPLVMTFEERFASLKSCPYVDQVVDYGMYWATLELLDELEDRKHFHDGAHTTNFGSARGVLRPKRQARNQRSKLICIILRGGMARNHPATYLNF
ncbi:unnamed protein product [Nippostrongylus brasiliensis]|uniref:choline-phosphate cytidylyltransferase n=1 Tax=Nippostrongylus brasiliensis TaxID=27835 RepID=A0A0N4YQK1_NIPBR|nr:unnamed protein product [Nippostrongylus brasiliensis]